MHLQSSAVAIRGAQQIEANCPHRSVEILGNAGLIPSKGRLTAAGSVDHFERDKFARKNVELELEAIEIVTAEGRHENVANLFVIAGDLELFGGAADSEIVHEYLRLIESAVRDTRKFSEFEIAEMLDADPDADAEHG